MTQPQMKGRKEEERKKKEELTSSDCYVVVSYVYLIRSLSKLVVERCTSVHSRVGVRQSKHHEVAWVMVIC